MYCLKGLSTQFCGINDSQLRILGAVNAKLTFDGEARTVRLLVVPNDTMKPSMILGRDVLKEWGYALKKDQDCLDACVSEILNIDVSDNQSQQTGILDVNPELSMSIQTEVSETFEKDYLLPKRPEKPVVDAELKLTLKEHQAFSVVPRRLSHLERCFT